MIIHTISISGALVTKKERNYLERYGYIEERGLLSTLTTTSIRRAISQFQGYAGLPKTGKLNVETKEAMRSPRCGNKDKLISLRSIDRWKKKKLTFRLRNYPTNSRLAKEEVDAEVEKAFAMWQEKSPLRFTKKQFGKVDIEISFEKKYHGENDYFDKGELAHAFLPQDGGDIHIADSEFWTKDEYNGKNLLWTVVHELGHSLGLKHSEASGAVMGPFYLGWDPFLALSQDDIEKILSRY